MGRISKGILGPVSGTVGTVVGSTWKGISYVRSQPASKKHEPTVNQLDQQLKFSITLNFVQTYHVPDKKFHTTIILMKRHKTFVKL